MAKTTGGGWIFPAVVVATAGAAVAAQSGPQPIGVWVFAVVLGGWVITLCLHEFAHAAVAYAGGDTSVRARGYLTLNPLRYTDLAYSVIIPILLLAVGGIPLPGGAVLVEPGRLRRRWYASLVSAAGPATNLVAGLILAVASSFTAASGDYTALAAALSYLALLQFVAGILNLLPIPGFDGFGIIEPYLSYRFTGADPARSGRGSRWWSSSILFSVPGASSLAVHRRLPSCSTWPAAATTWPAVGAGLFRFWA